MSALEAFTNAAIGFVVSWSATYFVLPVAFGIAPGAGASFGITAMFFVLSFARAWAIREAFRKWGN